jgi:hypothetical protein
LDSNVDSGFLTDLAGLAERRARPAERRWRRCAGLAGRDDPGRQEIRGRVAADGASGDERRRPGPALRRLNRWMKCRQRSRWRRNRRACAARLTRDIY